MTRAKLTHVLGQVLWQLLALAIALEIGAIMGIRKINLIDFPIAAVVLFVVNSIQVLRLAKRSRSTNSHKG